MFKKLFQISLMCCVILISSSFAAAHCEIPCGIYDDEMRIRMIAEDITTIEKSMQQVIELSGKTPLDHNQITRWVMNKEHHADKIQEIVAQYFMAQRIKPGDSDYMKKMSILHSMLITAMKCKQTTDVSHTAELNKLLKEFHDVYFGGRNE